MSKYTTEVRYICETYAGHTESVGYDDIDSVLNSSYTQVFDFDFPLFDNTYRPVLCKKILKHYYTREIGEETVGLWKLRLNMRMNEIMPYYNKLYEMAMEDGINLFDNTNLKKTGNREEDVDKSGSRNTDTAQDRLVNSSGTYEEEGGGTNSGDNQQINLFSDTPQNGLTNVANQSYLTDARKINDTIDEETTYSHDGSTTGRTSEEGSGSEGTVYEEGVNTTTEYLEHIFGKSGGETYAELFMKFKDALLDVDMMIINNLSDLFMNIW